MFCLSKRFSICVQSQIYKKKDVLLHVDNIRVSSTNLEPGGHSKQLSFVILFSGPTFQIFDYFDGDIRSSNSIEHLVHADPSPIPPPRPVAILRAPEAPPLASTTPAIPPNTNPAVVWTTIFSNPFLIVADTASSDATGTDGTDSASFDILYVLLLMYLLRTEDDMRKPQYQT